MKKYEKLDRSGKSGTPSRMGKILGVGAGILIIVLAVTLTLGLVGRTKRLQEVIQSTSLLLGEKISSKISNIFNFSLDLEDIGDFADITYPVLTLTPDVAYIMVSGPGGDLLFGSGLAEGKGRIDSELLGNMAERLEVIQKKIVWEGKKYFHTAIPLIDGQGKYRGAVLLGIPVENGARVHTGNLEKATMFIGLIQGKFVADEISRLLALGLALSDMDSELGALCSRNSEEDPNLSYLMVIGKKGMILGHSDREKEGQIAGRDLFDEDMSLAEITQKNIILNGEKILHSVIPLHTETGAFQGAVLSGYREKAGEKAAVSTRVREKLAVLFAKAKKPFPLDRLKRREKELLVSADSAAGRIDRKWSADDGKNEMILKLAGEMIGQGLSLWVMDRRGYLIYHSDPVIRESGLLDKKFGNVLILLRYATPRPPSSGVFKMKMIELASRYEEGSGTYRLLGEERFLAFRNLPARGLLVGIDEQLRENP